MDVLGVKILVARGIHRRINFKMSTRKLRWCHCLANMRGLWDKYLHTAQKMVTRSCYAVVLEGKYQSCYQTPFTLRACFRVAFQHATFLVLLVGFKFYLEPWILGSCVLPYTSAGYCFTLKILWWSGHFSESQLKNNIW